MDKMPKQIRQHYNDFINGMDEANKKDEVKSKVTFGLTEMAPTGNLMIVPFDVNTVSESNAKYSTLHRHVWAKMQGQWHLTV